MARFTNVILTFFVSGLLFAAEPIPKTNYKDDYVRKTFGTKAILYTGIHAAWGQTVRSPKEWARTAGGFGKRVASGFGTHLVKNSIEYPIAAWRHEDLRYHPSTKTRFAPRLQHALLSTIITQKTTTGQKTFASGRFAGIFGSALISRTWQPVAYRTVGGGVATGGYTLGFDAVSNIVQEFWPRRNQAPRN